MNLPKKFASIALLSAFSVAAFAQATPFTPHSFTDLNGNEVVVNTIQQQQQAQPFIDLLTQTQPRKCGECTVGYNTPGIFANTMGGRVCDKC